MKTNTSISRPARLLLAAALSAALLTASCGTAAGSAHTAGPGDPGASDRPAAPAASSAAAPAPSAAPAAASPSAGSPALRWIHPPAPAPAAEPAETAGTAGPADQTARADSPDQKPPEPLSAAQAAQMEQSLSRFAAVIREKNPGGVHSPLSYYLALAALRPGLAGDQLARLDSVLNPGGLSDAEFESLLGQIHRLGEKPGAEADWLLRTAAFGDRTYTFRSDYLDRLQAMGMASAGADLADPAAYEAINGWVAEQTRGLIKPFFSAEQIARYCGSDTRLILLNTLYFKDFWDETFSPAATRDRTFHGARGDTTVPMMHGSLIRSYLETDRYQAVRLPFARGTVLTVVLPKETVSEADVFAMLDDARHADAWSEARVELDIPKWEQSASIDLTRTLTDFDLGDLLQYFDGSHIFETDGSLPLKVSDIIQRVEFKCDESGAEAAAATAVAVAETLAIAPDQLPVVQMTADRPFAYTMDENGLCLFEGTVQIIDPQ